MPPTSGAIWVQRSVSSRSVLQTMVPKVSTKFSKAASILFQSRARQGRCVLQRPSAMKAKAWKDVPYTWHPSNQMANGFREEAASRCFSKMGFCLPGMEDVGGVPCPSFTSILTIYILSSQTVVALGVCPCEDGEVEADEMPPQPEDVRGLSSRARFYLQS